MKKRFLPVIASLGFAGSLTGQVEPLAGYASIVEVRRAHATERLFDAAPPAARRGGVVFLEGRYIQREIEQPVLRDTDGFGARVGGDWLFPRGAVELSLDFENTDSDFFNTFDGTRGTVGAEAATLALTGRMDFQGWFFTVGGGYGRTEYDVERRTVTGTKTASFTGNDYFGFARVDRNFRIGYGLRFRPFAGISTSRVRHGTFSETDAPDARRVLGDTHSETMTAVGARVEKQMRSITPSASLAWASRVGSSDFSVRRTNLEGTPDPNTVASEEITAPYRGLLVGEVAIAMRLSQNVHFTPGIRYMHTSDDARWNAGAVLSYRY